MLRRTRELSVYLGGGLKGPLRETECDGGGKKWSSFGYILKVEPIEFGEELSMEYERKG